MKKRISIGGFIMVLTTVIGASLAVGTDATKEERLAQTIVDIERAALERWGNGDPDGYLEIYTPDITYFDPSLERRKDGLSALTEYYAGVRGKVKVDEFELVEPKVQINGATAVLTFNLIDHTIGADGTRTPTSRWNSTEVYVRVGDEWKIVHSHWSLTKPKLAARNEE
jgi:ketosteroid isomerase-like protein